MCALKVRYSPYPNRKGDRVERTRLFLEKIECFLWALRDGSFEILHDTVSDSFLEEYGDCLNDRDAKYIDQNWRQVSATEHEKQILECIAENGVLQLDSESGTTAGFRIITKVLMALSQTENNDVHGK